MRAAVGLIVIEFPSPYASDAQDYLRKGLAMRDALRNEPLLQFLPGAARAVYGQRPDACDADRHLRKRARPPGAHRTCTKPRPRSSKA